jgi:RNA polymerase sigma-70 factor, ECF subfamily
MVTGELPRMPCQLPIPQRSDEDLAVAAQAGCAASLDQLLRRYQAPVLHFLRHRGARADAEDLLQETFLRACAHLHRYRRRWRWRTWVFTIARRVGMNARRRSRPASDDEALQSAPTSLPNPAELVAEEDLRQHLWEAAARILTEAETTALWLRYVEELSVREVAAAMGRPWVAVKVQLFRSRKKLLPELRRLGYAPLHLPEAPRRTHNHNLPADIADQFI